MEAGRLPVAPPVDRPRETLRQIGHVAHEAFAARDGAGDSPVRRTSAIGGMIDKATFLRQQPVQERIHSHNRLHSRSEEHTSELQSLMRISYAVFCLKKKKQTNIQQYNNK